MLADVIRRYRPRLAGALLANRHALSQAAECLPGRSEVAYRLAVPCVEAVADGQSLVLRQVLVDLLSQLRHCWKGKMGSKMGSKDSQKGALYERPTNLVDIRLLLARADKSHVFCCFHWPLLFPLFLPAHPV